MKKTLFAVAILLGVGGAVSAQDANGARPKKTTKAQTTTSVQNVQKAEPLKATVVTDEQIRKDKIKEKEAAKKAAAKKIRLASDTQN